MDEKQKHTWGWYLQRYDKFLVKYQHNIQSQHAYSVNKKGHILGNVGQFKDDFPKRM